MLNIYVTNLGKYNEGSLVGQWLTLPATEEQIQDAMVNIGVATIVNGEYKSYKIEVENGIEYMYEEYFITDSESDIPGLEIGEYSNINNLNELAAKFENVEEYELEQLKALLEGGYVENKEILENEISELTEDHTFLELENNSLLNDNTKLGYAIIEQIYCDDLSQINNLEYYFDTEKFARDLHFDYDSIVEDMEDDDKKELENMSELEFANWYIDSLGDVKELGTETLERYFSYEKYGRDANYNGAFIASNNMAIL